MPKVERDEIVYSDDELEKSERNSILCLFGIVTFFCSYASLIIWMLTMDGVIPYVISSLLYSVPLFFMIIMTISTVKRLYFMSHREKILEEVIKNPKKLKNCLLISSIIVFPIAMGYFTAFLVAVIIPIGIGVYSILTIHCSVTTAIAPAHNFFYLLIYYVLIPTLTISIFSRPTPSRLALWGCMEIKMKKGKWGTGAFFRFGKIRKVLQKSFNGIIPTIVPVEETITLIRTQYGFYSAMPEELEEITDDTIRFILYPHIYRLQFCKSLNGFCKKMQKKILKKFEKDNLDITEYIQKTGKKKWGISVEKQQYTSVWIYAFATIIGTIGTVIVALLR